MVLAQSLFKTLKQQAPDRAIDVLAPAWSRPLTRRMPEIRNAIDAPFAHGTWRFGARRQLGHKLRGRYQRAIVLPNSWKSALVPYFARIPQRTGYLGEQRYGLLNDRRHLDKKDLPMTVQRFVALADPQPSPFDHTHSLPVPQLDVAPGAAANAARELDIALPATPLLALCPGAAFGPAKRWPQSHYAELARNKLDQGWQVWLFGSRADAPVCTRINELCDQACLDLSGRTSLDQAIDLLSLATVVVSNDSGLMHVGAALTRPLVAVFGSSSPRHTPPLGTNARVLWKQLSCSPCFKRTCPLGHTNCLQQLSADEVLAEMAALLP